jgi:RNA recognition motif-containing protein
MNSIQQPTVPIPSSPAQRMKVPWLCVDGLERTYSDAQLGELCIPFGKVLKARVTRNSRGDSLGHGYVEMATEASAQTAAKALDMTEVLGKMIHLSLVARYQPNSMTRQLHGASKKK